MIHHLYGNSTDITERTLATNHKSILYIAQDVRGRWHWRRSCNGCTYTSREHFASEQDALRAVADVANATGATLKVTPDQKQFILFYWLDLGAAAFAGGVHYESLVGGYVRRGWMQAAERAAVLEESDSKPFLADGVPVALTLEEALRYQAGTVG